MNDADQACYVAKDLGRGCAYTHSEEDTTLTNRLGEKLQRKDIDDALSDERFMLLYQPIVGLDPDAGRRSQARVEVLLRMFDENNNVITPGAFLPAASRFGLTTQIDRWVVNRVLRFYSHLFVQNPDLVVNLNLSASSIADESLADFILPLFDSTVASPGQICFETSEASFNQNIANATRLIERLQSAGCGFALDNFGRGLASFEALKDLRIDFVKIDSHLIRNICSDEVDYAMVESIHSMASLLGIKTVAENVDSEAVVAKLNSIGIDYAQGYHLGDLMHLDDMGKVTQDLRVYENQLN